VSVVETIAAHRSIRAYRPDPLPEEDLETILHAATRASSSGNMQTYSIVVTRDAARRRALWRMHGEQDMILQAPLLLTFCADWNRMVTWCRARRASPAYGNFLSFLVAFADALIAAQNAALAAESLGYGICYMGTTLWATRELSDFLELPELVFPATTLVVGTPDEDPAPRARLPIESIVHDETYRGFDDARITETYRSREVEGWNRYMALADLREAILESGVENLAQVYTDIKYTAPDNARFSRDLLEVLARQGFLPRDGSGGAPTPHGARAPTRR
jgi:nitroreductase